MIAALEPTFGGINLEDIKAPDCFYVERRLRERMKIPVFHDDQHGTAIVVGAALLNALKVVGKAIGEVKLVTSGAGAAALACLGLLVKLGVRRENIWVTDLAGVVYEGRTELMDEDKVVFAQTTDQRTLAEVMAGADVFLGLSAGGVLKPEMVATMAAQPVIFALANPTPEIMPEEAKAVRPDAIIATGRTDYPNQVNNVLCFPYIFRGALDCGATTVTDAMEIAAVHAIAELAQAEQSEVVAAAYAGANLSFGPEYLIPKPFDPAADDEDRAGRGARRSRIGRGDAADRRPGGLPREAADLRLRLGHDDEADLHAGQARASTSAWPTPRARRSACCAPCRWWSTKAWRGPTLIGRPAVIAAALAGLRPAAEGGRRLRRRQRRARRALPRLLADLPPHDRAQGRHGAGGQDRDAAPADADRRHAAAQGRGRRPAVRHLGHHRQPPALHRPGDRQAPGRQPAHAQDVQVYACMNGLMLPGRQVFLVDTHVNDDPSAEELAEITVMAAEEMLRFGIAAQGGAAVALQLRHQRPAPAR